MADTLYKYRDLPTATKSLLRDHFEREGIKHTPTHVILCGGNGGGMGTYIVVFPFQHLCKLVSITVETIVQETQYVEQDTAT